MANYVTKTVRGKAYQILAFHLEENEVKTYRMTMTGNPTEKQVVKHFESTWTKCRFIRLENETPTETTYRMLTEDFIEQADILLPDATEVGMVTRSIPHYETTVLTYNLNTDNLEPLLYEIPDKDINKKNIPNRVYIKTLDEIKTNVRYGIDLDRFIELAEPVEF